MGKKGSKKGGGHACGRIDRREGRQIRTEADIVRENEGGGEDGTKAESFRIDVAMWEFGQNDPKRDSGSKLVRFGMARKLRVGQSWPGIVLSSEAHATLSPADKGIILKHGIAGINCSWNRLVEIPFGMMGRAQCQRKLPLLVAANTVNYGKPFKMNTAEAIAGSLYIVGLKDEARQLLYPFSFGPEFLRLNMGALEAYSQCETAAQVEAVVAGVMAEDAELKKEKQRRKEMRCKSRDTSNYIDDADLLPGYSGGGAWSGDGEGEDERELARGRGGEGGIDGEDDLMPGYDGGVGYEEELEQYGMADDDLMPGYSYRGDDLMPGYNSDDYEEYEEQQEQEQEQEQGGDGDKAFESQVSSTLAGLSLEEPAPTVFQLASVEPPVTDEAS
jgi:pre-rRNA-processing protein TSR3